MRKTSLATKKLSLGTSTVRDLSAATGGNLGGSKIFPPPIPTVQPTFCRPTFCTCP